MIEAVAILIYPFIATAFAATFYLDMEDKGISVGRVVALTIGMLWPVTIIVVALTQMWKGWKG